MDVSVDVSLVWEDAAYKFGRIPLPLGPKAVDGPRPYPKGFDPAVIPPGRVLKSFGKALTPPFFDDMEGGPNGWTATGFWRQITNPQNLAVSPEINPRLVFLPDAAGRLPAPASGMTCWWYGEESTGTFIGNDFWRGQPDGSGGTSTVPNGGGLLSPAFDLSAASTASLSFKTWWEIEGVDVDRFDMMFVEVSVDGGVNFEPLGAGSINPADDVDGESWRPYSSGGLGEVGEWLDISFDLTPYVGSDNVQILFRFETIDELYNGFRGWFIDDVAVDADIAAPAPVIEDVNPGSGYAGTLVYVTGANFVNGARVRIGSVLAHALVVGTNLCHVTVPQMPAGVHDVTLTNPDGQSDTLEEGFEVTVVQPPSVSAIDPNWGYSTEQTNVTITGAGFDAGATASVGGVGLLGVAVLSETEITGTVPIGLPVGFQNVRVTNPDEQFGSLIGGFQVVPPCPTTYDVYLNGQLICADTSYRACTPPYLLSGAVYEWQVVSKNRSEQTEGFVWVFTTEGLCDPPGKPVNPDPPDETVGAPITSILRWAPEIPVKLNPDNLGDTRDAAPPAAPWKQSAVNGELFTTTDNQDNAGSGNPDNDMDVYLFRGDPGTPIEFDILYSGGGTPTTVQLMLYAWDVDETDGEVDYVYFNGTRLGKMTGANNEWSTTAFNVNPALLQVGQNRVQVTIDEQLDHWAINVDWAQLVIDHSPGGDASIRYAVTDKDAYMPGNTVVATVEVDTTAPTQDVKVETNLIDPLDVNVAGTSHTYTIALNADLSLIHI